jgi:hypothetical protein
VKRADPVLPNDEQAVWDSGVFNIDLSTELSYIVFFDNCNFFGFRALDEHKQLDASKFNISVYTNGNKELHYTGRLCKHVQGGLNNRNVDVKRITQKSDPSNPRFIVKGFDKYLQHIQREGRFYRKPLVNKGSDKSIRFSVQSIGINTLSNRMKDLFQAAGILLENSNITNHSGKVTCTNLFNAGFSDSSVTSRSGNKSGAVETYTRPLEALRDSVSHALQPPKPTITACDTDNTATSVNKNDNDNKENCREYFTMF